MSDLVTEEIHRAAMQAANGAIMYGADYRAMKIGLDAAAPLIVATFLEGLVDGYPDDVFTPEGTSKDTVSGTALRIVLTAQAKALRGEVR